MNKHKFFVGDTLMEVMFAIGILSLVIVSVVSLMNSGSNKISNTLEYTMARNEIDAQAEALRYIHDSYIAERNKGEESRLYSSVWSQIKEKALKNTEDIESIISYEPGYCQSFYEEKGEVEKYGFILNYKNINKEGVKNVFYDAKNNKDLFKPASIYPRLIFNNKDDFYVGIDDGKGVNFVAEGIYIIAVQDAKNGTTTPTEEENGTTQSSAYYDFYIRSCWQSLGNSAPSSTSTVVRLYDPDIETINYQLITFTVNFEVKDATIIGTVPVTKTAQAKVPVYTFGITEQQPLKKDKKEQIGWALTTFSEGVDFCTKDAVFSVGGSIGVKYENPIVTLKPIFDCPYQITFHYNNGTDTTKVYKEVLNKKEHIFNYNETFKETNNPTRDGYTFIGWNSNQDSPEAGIETEKLTAPGKTTADAWAVFRENYVITYDANGGSNAPDKTICTSEILQKSCTISRSKTPTRTGYKFVGWSTKKEATQPEYPAGGSIKMPLGNFFKITLYAVWSEFNETINAELKWGETPRDLDSHCVGVKADGAQFHAYYGSKIGNDIDGTIIAQLDKDVTTGFGPENLIINTRGGHNYYYYVYNWSSNSTITGATVTITNETTGDVYTVRSNEGTGSGRYWHIFTYKDGEIIITNKHDDTADVAR